MKTNVVYTHPGFLDACFVCLEDEGNDWYRVLWFLKRDILRTGNWRYTIPLTYAESILIGRNKAREFEELAA